MSRPSDMYPDGYPLNKEGVICGDENKIRGAICIIDNKHPGRRHFGQDTTGRYCEWGQAGKVLTITNIRKLS